MRKRRETQPEPLSVSFDVSTHTVRKWLPRFRREGQAGLENRSSAPHLDANKLPALAHHDGRAASRVPHDGRGDRPAASPAEEHRRQPSLAAGARSLGRTRESAPARRYSRARAGELVHLDIKKLACFRRIGHRIIGDRRQGSEGAGWEFVRVAVDDASRLAYVEVLPEEKRQSITGFLVRALRWFKRQGVRVERVMAATVLTLQPSWSKRRIIHGSTERRRAGILVGVHPGGPSAVAMGRTNHLPGFSPDEQPSQTAQLAGAVDRAT